MLDIVLRQHNIGQFVPGRLAQIENLERKN